MALNNRFRLAVAVVSAMLATVFVATVASAQWPTTCVELNDIVELHLGNYHNVGIYQRVHGDDAEQACRNEHGNDVRSVFAWAISTPGATPPPAHPDFEGIRQVAVARGASPEKAVDIANSVISGGTTALFLAGLDSGVEYGTVDRDRRGGDDGRHDDDDRDNGDRDDDDDDDD